MNAVNLIGNITRDLELRHTTGSNIPYVFFTVAVNNSYTDKNGEKVDTADFVECIAWRNTAENLVQYHGKKGDPVAVVGKIEQFQTEKDGVKRYGQRVQAHRVQFLNRYVPQNTGATESEPEVPMTEDVPF